MNLWQRKLLAFLHDPPSKAFNLVEHREMAESLIRNAGFAPEDVAWFFDKVCDHTAAAADRVVCPKSTALKAGWDAMSAFKHPLGGGELRFKQPINPHEAETEVAAQQPQGDWSKISSEEEQQHWARFFIHWRLWRQRCAEKHPSLAHLPADTRIPDHTIWTHCSIVSALQACVRFERKGDNVENREFQPAFLLVQIGPVQEFIAQARSTRDLWSGSYLLSWLIVHGIKAITDKIGPDGVLFPSLRGQPLFDFLHKETLYDKLGMWKELRHADEHVLTPNLPNRFLVVAPVWKAQQLAEAAEEDMTAELQRIGDECAAWLNVEDSARARWDQQLRQFLSVTWQVWPWETDGKALVEKTPSLRAAYDAAVHGIPKEHLDPRNYRHQSWREGDRWQSKVSDDPPVIDNPGFAWATHYAKVDRLLAARRNTRDFDAWAAMDTNRDGAVKDMLSGKEEVIGSEDWQEGLPEIAGHFFKGGERLGALNLIKRIWHRAYLKEKQGLTRTPKFDSLPAVAAAPYALGTIESLRGNADQWTAFVAFQKAAIAARKWFDADISDATEESRWRQDTDASVFHLTEWDRAIRDCGSEEGRKQLLTARDALRDLGGAPGKYVAVLALDGDSMGEWVSGAKSPLWKTQLANEAAEYFQKHEPLQALLEAPRHVSPSYHLQLSEALGNFALYLAGPIVESFDGQLIYAGGDDVLAMLPAENALKCAHALRLAFRGDPQLHAVFEGALDIGDQKGFVGLTREAEKGKRLRRFIPIGHPLLVPGMNADLSAGIAIGHMHAPLQNLVEAARAAEKRAKKDYGKSAFAVSLFKRSGETIQWGAKWESRAIALAEQFTQLTEDDRLSAKFPYALARLLRAYAIEKNYKIEQKNGFNPFEVFPAEFAHCIRQQGEGIPENFFEIAKQYLTQCKGRRLDDFLGPFLTTVFIHRGGDA